MEKLQQIKDHLFRFALLAVSEVEVSAIEFAAAEGQKWLSEEKRQQAKGRVMELYARFTANTPVLKDTDIDDRWVKEVVGEVLDEACEFLLGKLNALSEPPVTDAPELEPGRVEDAK